MTIWERTYSVKIKRRIQVTKIDQLNSIEVSLPRIINRNDRFLATKVLFLSKKDISDTEIVRPYTYRLFRQISQNAKCKSIKTTLSSRY